MRQEREPEDLIEVKLLCGRKHVMVRAGEVETEPRRGTGARGHRVR